MNRRMLARVNRAFDAVLKDPGAFDDFQVAFVTDNAKRLERFRGGTAFTPRQWRVVERIETRMRELAD